MLLTEIANFLDESKLVPILVLAHMFFDKHRHIFGEFQACVCLAAAIHAIDRNRHFFGTIQACTFSASVICLFDKIATFLEHSKLLPILPLAYMSFQKTQLFWMNPCLCLSCY